MKHINLSISVPRIARVSADGKHCDHRCSHRVTDQVFHVTACWLNKARGERAIPLVCDEAAREYLRCQLCLASEQPE